MIAELPTMRNASNPAAIQATTVMLRKAPADQAPGIDRPELATTTGGASDSFVTG